MNAVTVEVVPDEVADRAENPLDPRFGLIGNKRDPAPGIS
jgi:hypothetical protein